MAGGGHSISGSSFPLLGFVLPLTSPPAEQTGFVVEEDFLKFLISANIFTYN